MKTYLVGRESTGNHCDILLPASERSVSRRHLEMTVSESGKCYLVHLHPVNVTRVWDAACGQWVDLKQQYVDWDAPLMLGDYRTSARQLLAGTSSAHERAVAPETADVREEVVDRDLNRGKIQWDPEAGSFKHF